MDFKDEGDVIFLLGELVEDIGSSEYVHHYHNVKHSPAPYLNLTAEKVLHKLKELQIDIQNIKFLMWSRPHEKLLNELFPGAQQYARKPECYLAVLGTSLRQSFVCWGFAMK